MPRLPALALALVPFVAGSPLLAQDGASSPTRPPGERVAVTHSAGLAPARNGDGLLGGGNHYRVRCTAAGTRFEPALGSGVATTQHLALRPVAVRRGESVVATPDANVRPVARDRVAVWQHAPAIAERFAMRPDDAELSWRFEQPLPGSGDLVVRYACDTSLPPPRTDRGGLAFELPDGRGGVRIGGVTGIDARGATVAGAVTWNVGVLELSLPAAFVANATYPLVLDPAVGPIVPVSTVANDDSEPDAAYDATTATYLVVWLRTFSATDADVRGQRVSSGGALLGTTIYFGSSGAAQRPRVANHPSTDRFLVVWAQEVGATSSIELEAIAAASGASVSSISVVDGTGGAYRKPDVVCQQSGAALDRSIAVVFENTWVAMVVFLRFDGSALTHSSGQAIPTGNAMDPAIVRTVDDDQTFVLVWRAYFSNSLVARRCSLETGSSGPDVVVHQVGQNESMGTTDVDGRDGHCIAVWERSVLGTNSIAARTLANGPGPLELTVGPLVTVAGSQLLSATAPSVAWSPMKTWLGYRTQLVNSGPTRTLRVTGVDTSTCASCNDTFAEIVYGSERRIVVATAAAGGTTTNDNALAVWAKGGDVFAQRLLNHGTGGTIALLGGGCGNGGTQSFNHTPSIGGSSLLCTVTGLPAGTLVTTCNVSPVVTPVVCGSCEWLPYATTTTPFVFGATASAPLPIPCQLALIGSMFETQWTTAVSGQAPCSLMPGFVFSGRARLTIGQ